MTLSCLLFGVQCLPVGAVVTLEEAQMSHPLPVGVKLGNHIHALQQIAVVANNERRAGQHLQCREELGFRRGVQVVRRFVEQNELWV